MDKPKKYEERIMAALNFDEDDLAANAAGSLSQAQRADLDAEQRRSALVVIFIVLPMIAWLGIGLYFGGLAAASLLILAILAPIFAIPVLIYAAKLFRLRRDAQAGDVRTAEGRVSLSMRAVSANNVQCTLKVGDVKFMVKEKAFLAFKNGDPYSIYYTPYSRRILSVEWLREADPGAPNLISTNQADTPDEVTAFEPLEKAKRG
ncbi:MAG: hypothetical protein GC204_09120 [Chloroflexi bacterium]|nr:hypothetical protein [Chloroflexota bacterium]